MSLENTPSNTYVAPPFESLSFFPSKAPLDSYEVLNISEGTKSFYSRSAFINFKNLNVINVPKSVQSLNLYIFAMRANFHSKLEKIWIDSDNLNYTSNENGLVFTKDMKTLYFVPPNAKNCSIPNLVENINTLAFINCNEDGSLIIPNSVKTIGNGAFQNSKFSKIEFQENSNITSLSVNAFRNCSITTISIPQNIQSIEAYAFYNCTNLSKIVFPENSQLRYIRESAFYSTNISEITLPNLVYISNYTFSYCLSLKSVYIGSRTLISIETFSYAPNIENIVISESNVNYTLQDHILSDKMLTTIYYILPTSSINLKTTIVSFSRTIFQQNSQLENIYVETGNYKFSSYNGMLYSQDFSTAILCPGRKSKILFHQKTNQIGPNCFTGNKNIEYIDFTYISFIGESAFESAVIHQIVNMQNVQIIRICAFKSAIIDAIILNNANLVLMDNAFQGAEIRILYIVQMPNQIYSYQFLNAKITNISIGTQCSMTNIASYMFYSSSLPKIQLNNQIITISSFSFYMCSNLESIKFDQNLEKIADYAFAYCSKLRQIFLPPSLKTIGLNAFYNCSSLEIVYMASCQNLNNLGVAAFGDCEKLTEIYFPSSTKIFLNAQCFLGSRLEKIVTSNVFLFDQSSGILSDSRNSTIYYAGKVNFSSITIPDSFMQIYDYAFYKCTNLVEITFNRFLLRIGSHVFEYCSNLERIIFLSNYNVMTIGDNTFAQCGKLTNISFGTNFNINSIGNNCFYGCQLLENITIPTSLTSIGNGTFSMCYFLKNINFENVTSSVPISLKTIPNNFLTYSIDLEYIFIPKEIISIESYAFTNCINLKNIEFERNSKMKQINENAFLGCQSLVNFTLPDCYSIINASCFGNTSTVKRIIIESNLNMIDFPNKALAGTFVEYIEIGQGISSILIKGNAFSNFATLKEFVCNSSVQIEDGAFEFCTNLIKVIIHEVKTLGTGVFMSCTSIISVDFNFSNEYIPFQCFLHCTSLQYVNTYHPIRRAFPMSFMNCQSLRMDFNDLEYVHSYAFKSASLQNIPQKIISIQDHAFENCNFRQKKLIFPNTLNYLGDTSFNYVVINRIYYCSSKDFSNIKAGFSNNVIAYVTSNYKYQSFCGLQIYRTSQCGVAPKTSMLNPYVDNYRNLINNRIAARSMMRKSR